MVATPLQSNFLAGRTPPPIAPPTVDFTRLQKQFVDSTKATGDYLKSLGKLEVGFGSLGKTASKTTESVRAVDRTINILGLTFKGTAKELIQVGTALGVVSGGFFDLQQKAGLVTAPLKGIVDALGAISDKAKGVEIAQAIGVDTTGIQQLELFRAGIFGNVEALQAFRTSSQTAGIAFTLNLTKLNTILKASKDELRSVGVEARKLSKDLGGAVSSTDIVAGQYQIASAGFTKAGDSRAIAEASGKLATVGFNDFFSTADLVTKSLRAYGLQASKASDIAAKLNAVVEVGITTIPELAAGFGETAVVANAFGINIDQLGAAIATITTQGSSTPEALTGIEALFRTLANQSPQATKALSELSLNGQRVKFDIATVQAKGLGNALTDVFKAANGNVEILREIIPESRALQAALALAAQGGSLFAESLEAVSQSSPTKLNDIFGEVQEDPTIKLKAITTKAGELVGSLAGNYETFTDSAVNSLAKFVDVTEAIASNPAVQFISSSFLLIADTVGKVTGVFAALSGAAFSVIGTLASINIFNNLFNGGLLKQGKLIQQSVVSLKDFGLVVQQITGTDTTKSVITGLTKQVEDLRIKGAALRLANPQDAQAIEENSKKLKDLGITIAGIRKDASKPYVVAFKGIVEAKKEVQALEAELSKLGTDDPKRAELLNKQRDAIGKVGEERLNVENEVRKQQKAGTITAIEAERRRIGANKQVASVSSLGKGQDLFDSVTQRTTIGDITAQLQKEKDKGAKADASRVSNLTESLKQVNQGTLGVIDQTGRLTEQYKQTTNFGQKAGIAIGKGWDFATKSFGRSKQELQGVDQALQLASRSENISNFGTAAGKLFSSTGSGIKLLAGGIKTASIATAKFGVEFLGNFINPLSAGLAVIALVGQGISEYTKGRELQQDTAEKFAEAERKKTEAIRNTTKAIEEQARIQKLVAGGLTEKEAVKKVADEKQETDLRKQLPLVNGDRRVRLQAQLVNKDFRSADTFASEEIGKLRENKLGIGTDNGAAVLKQNVQNDVTVGTVAAFSGAGAALIGAKFGAVLGSIVPGLGTLLGAAAGAAIGLGISQLIANLTKGDAIDKIESEFTARRQNELEKKFKVNEAKTPEERAKRQGKAAQQLEIDKVGFRAATDQAGLNDNVIQELVNSKDNNLKGTGLLLKKLQTDIADTNQLLLNVDKSFKDNKVPEDLFETEGLSTKINKLLAGKGSATVQDLSIVDAEIEGKIAALKIKKQLADDRQEEARNSGNKDAASQLKKQSESIAGQIEDFAQFKVKLKPKLELSNKDVQNALRNGQGAFAAVSIKEETSAINSIDSIKKALANNETIDRASLASNIQSFSASLETLTEIDPTKVTDLISDIRALLSGKDVGKLDAQQIIALQNTVSTATVKLAQERITKFETLARRTQGLASSSGFAGQKGQELQSSAELQVIDKKIEAQKEVVALAQTAAAKEKATNDLIQLQLDKKTKTIETRLQKELNAANLIYEREKARLDLQKAALDLTKSDLDLKKQIFEQFGLQTEGVDTDLAKNKLQQLQADGEAQRKSIAKERADLILQQQAGLEQSKNLNQANISNPIEDKVADPKTKVDNTKYTKFVQAIDKREEDLVKATNDKFDSISLAKDTQIKNINDSDKGNNGQRIAAKLEKERADIEAKRQAKLDEIKRDATSARAEAASADGFNKATQNKTIEKKGIGANPADVVRSAIGIGKDVAGSGEIAKQQKEELARFDARAKAEEELNKKREQAVQFEIDLAASYNAVIKPLERQSKLLQDTLSSTVQIFDSVKNINPLYVSQASLLGAIQASTAAQIVAARQTLDVETKKLDIQEQLLAKNGLLTADTKKQLDDQRTVLQNGFQQQVVSLQFQAKQDSIDAFAKKLQSTIEQKIKKLDIQKAGLQTFADSFEDDSKDGDKARKLAGALAINIAVQQAALAEQMLKIEQEKTLNLLKQNDIQLKFLDIQLQVQATQTKDKELLDSIASTRVDIGAQRGQIGKEIADAPARFAEEQALQRKQSTLAVSTASLQYTKEFDPKNLKAQQQSFLQQNGLDINQALGDTSINGAISSLSRQSTANQKDFAALQQQQPQAKTIIQPIRRESDGSITNLGGITVNINVAGTNATPAEIGKIVKQEMLNTTKELLRR